MSYPPCTLTMEELQPPVRDPSQHIMQIENTIRRLASENYESYTTRFRLPPPFYLPWLEELQRRGFKVVVRKNDWEIVIRWSLDQYCEMCRDAPATQRCWDGTVRLCDACVKRTQPLDAKPIGKKSKQVPLGTSFAPKREP